MSEQGLIDSRSEPGAGRRPGVGAAGALWLTALAGVGILLIEILGAKLLAPYLGDSHFVWTNQILVTLLALTAGYYLGGRLADRVSNEIWMCALFALSGAALCLTLVALEKAVYFFLRFHLGVGSILAAFFLYFAPLALLGMVGPMVVRRLTSDVSGVGRVAGRVMGFGTLGSVAGCLVAGLVLIPSTSNVSSMLGVAVALLVVGCGGVLLRLKSVGWRLSVIGALIAALFIGFIGHRIQTRPRVGFGREIARHDSGHSQLLVVDDAGSGYRYLVDDFVIQNCYHPETGISCASFTHALRALALAHSEKTDSVLCIGLGIGVVPMQFAESGAHVDVVEIHPGIVELAGEHFDFDPTRVNVHLEDGRNFLHHNRRKYDVIFFDAFSGDSSPSHLLTQEAFGDARAALESDGTLILNCIAATQPGEDVFLASVLRTMRSVFQSVRVYISPVGNVFLVARDSQSMEFVNTPAMAEIPDKFREEIARTMKNVDRENRESGIVLTDDFNPIEFYDAAYSAKAREQLAWLMYRK
jgi:spermidine synthase